MSRTKNGNLTGRAAATARREAIQDAVDRAWSNTERAQLLDKLGNAIGELKADDPNGWEKWYDETVPDFRASDSRAVLDVIDMIHRRIASQKITHELNTRAQGIADMLDDDGEFPLAFRFIEGEVFEVYPHRETGEIPF